MLAYSAVFLAFFQRFVNEMQHFKHCYDASFIFFFPGLLGFSKLKDGGGYQVFDWNLSLKQNILQAFIKVF